MGKKAAIKEARRKARALVRAETDAQKRLQMVRELQATGILRAKAARALLGET